MMYKEALELQALISITAGSYLDTKVQMIGNGEHIVLINSFFFLWCEEDWYKHKRKLLPVSNKLPK